MDDDDDDDCMPPFVLAIEDDTLRNIIETSVINYGMRCIKMRPIDLIEYDLEGTLAFLETGSDIALSVIIQHEHHQYHKLQDNTNIILITTREIEADNPTLDNARIDNKCAGLAILYKEDMERLINRILKDINERVGRFELCD